MPFARKEAYAKAVRKTSIERLARLIKVCSFLMQTKVYLFWCKEKMGNFRVMCYFYGPAKPLGVVKAYQ